MSEIEGCQKFELQSGIRVFSRFEIPITLKYLYYRNQINAI